MRYGSASCALSWIFPSTVLSFVGKPGAFGAHMGVLIAVFVRQAPVAGLLLLLALACEGF